MKKTLLTLAITLSVTCGASEAFAGPFDFVTQGQNTPASDNKVDLGLLNNNGARLITTVGQATISFSEAAVVMLSASGNKVAAEKLKASLEEIKKNPDDQEKIKNFVNGAGKMATEELDKINIDAKTKFDLSTEELVSAFEKMGSAAILDVKATGDASNLLKEATGLLETVSRNPVQYGFSAVTTVNSVISSGKFVGDNLPQQGKSIQNFTEKLVEYFKANKIPVPSVDRLQKIADGMQKE